MPLRRTLAALALLTGSALAHVFHPHPAVGLDVFLDQGPALIDVDGGVCKAEHILSSGNEAIATVGFKKKVAQGFFLPVFGQQPGLTTVTVTVNDGTAKIGGETVPCGEGGTQYVFEVRVWPDRDTYEKKVAQLVADEAKLLGQSTKEGVKQLQDVYKTALKAYKADLGSGLVTGGSTLMSVFMDSIMSLDGLARFHARLNASLVAMSQGGSDLLVACGFAEGFVVDAGFLPKSVEQGGGGGVAKTLDKLAGSVAKGEATIEKALKKTLGAGQKLGAKDGAVGDGNLVINPLPLTGSLLPFDTTGVLADGFGLHISGASSWAVWEQGTWLEVAGLGPPDSDVAVRVHDADGLSLGETMSRTDEEGVFTARFDKGLPPGQDVRITIEQDGWLRQLTATVANANAD